MWHVSTSVGGSLGTYSSKAEAMAVAKEYNRKGNRPGVAQVHPQGSNTRHDEYPQFEVGGSAEDYPDFEVH